jgi:hypothetical protein
LRRLLLFRLPSLVLAFGVFGVHAMGAKAQPALAVVNQPPQGAFYGDLTMSLIVLGLAGAVFALAAVGLKTLWVMTMRNRPPGGLVQARTGAMTGASGERE